MNHEVKLEEVIEMLKDSLKKIGEVLQTELEFLKLHVDNYRALSETLKQYSMNKTNDSKFQQFASKNLDYVVHVERFQERLKILSVGINQLYRIIP